MTLSRIYGFKTRFGKNGAEEYIETRKLKTSEIGYDAKKKKWFVETKGDIYGK